ncbi:MAG: hypothetical protein MSB12_00855 [Lentisphaeraceae bacterium]|nr:hypothetical protein [Lentisphaeraceae bacterium]
MGLAASADPFHFQMFQGLRGKYANRADSRQRARYAVGSLRGSEAERCLQVKPEAFTVFRREFEKALDGPQRYLLLLRLFASVHIDDPSETFFPPDFQFPLGFQDHVIELVKAGLVAFVDSSLQPVQQNEIPVLFHHFLITYKGRMELARLEQEIYLQSWKYKLKNIGWQSLTFIVGALVSAFIGYLFR